MHEFTEKEQEAIINYIKYESGFTLPDWFMKGNIKLDPIKVPDPDMWYGVCTFYFSCDTMPSDGEPYWVSILKHEVIRILRDANRPPIIIWDVKNNKPCEDDKVFINRRGEICRILPLYANFFHEQPLGSEEFVIKYRKENESNESNSILK
jgi:hypothetical protein